MKNDNKKAVILFTKKLYDAGVNDNDECCGITVTRDDVPLND